MNLAVQLKLTSAAIPQVRLEEFRNLALVCGDHLAVHWCSSRPGIDFLCSNLTTSQILGLAIFTLREIARMLTLCMTVVFVLGLLYAKASKRWRSQKDDIPGPSIGRLTTYYRVWLLMWGDAPRRYAELHRKYGPIVQTGPYHVSISESRWIPVVYDTKHQFRKVSRYCSQPT